MRKDNKNTTAVTGPKNATPRGRRRADRLRKRALEREISLYTSPADLAELDALLQAHDPDEAGEIRAIVDRNRLAGGWLNQFSPFAGALIRS